MYLVYLLDFIKKKERSELISEIPDNKWGLRMCSNHKVVLLTNLCVMHNQNVIIQHDKHIEGLSRVLFLQALTLAVCLSFNIQSEALSRLPDGH